MARTAGVGLKVANIWSKYGKMAPWVLPEPILPVMSTFPLRALRSAVTHIGLASSISSAPRTMPLVSSGGGGRRLRRPLDEVRVRSQKLAAKDAPATFTESSCRSNAVSMPPGRSATQMMLESFANRSIKNTMVATSAPPSSDFRLRGSRFLTAPLVIALSCLPCCFLNNGRINTASPMTLAIAARTATESAMSLPSTQLFKASSDRLGREPRLIPHSTKPYTATSSAMAAGTGTSPVWLLVRTWVIDYPWLKRFGLR